MPKKRRNTVLVLEVIEYKRTLIERKVCHCPGYGQLMANDLIRSCYVIEERYSMPVFIQKLNTHGDTFYSYLN